MRYIGQSGLRVSPIGLGTMMFGSAAGQEESFRIMDKALDHGVNLFDTAEIYPIPPDESYVGETERIMGQWFQSRGNRDKIILATKVAGSAAGWFAPPVRHRLTALDRHHIRRGVEGSLARLQTDYIDLYQIHWPDPIVPIEETLSVLTELVREGKIRYIGTSNDKAYSLTKALMTSEIQGLARYQSVQNNFSLLNRRFNEEQMPDLCRQEKVSLLPYSPLAGGALTGKYQNGQFPSRARFTLYKDHPNQRSQRQLERYLNDRARASIDRYQQIASEAGMTLTTLATAWSMHQDYVASTLVGATHSGQLDDPLKALDLPLEQSILAACDQVYQEIPLAMDFPSGQR